MKIQYCSDLHLEFPQNKAFLNAHPLPPRGEILILAGDIVPFHIMDLHQDFFSYLADHFKATYWLPGNHEYYRSDISERSGSVCEAIKSNIWLVNNHSLTLDQVQFFFTTLWGQIAPYNHYAIMNDISDFRLIKKNGNHFLASHFNELHQQARQFLQNGLAAAGPGKKMVITHHVPTLMNYPPRYKNSYLNEAFVVEMEGLIQDFDPNYWLYGHHHMNTPEFSLGKTRMITNQLGYLHAGEQAGFNPEACLDL